MPVLVFLPHPRIAWIARLRDDDLPLEELARRVEAGRWRPPAPWMAWLRRHFRLPKRPRWSAQVQGSLLAVAPRLPLVEKRPGAALALNPPLPLKPVQIQILAHMAGGRTAAQVAREMGHTERWVTYHLREVRAIRMAYLRRERRRKKQAGRGR